MDKTLDLVGKLSQTTVVNYLKKTNWDAGTDAPFVVELDPTSMCNLACPDCISGELLNKDQIEPERLASLVGELIAAKVRAVILIGGGEPMMHPSIGDVIERFGNHSIKVGITTNGLYLKKHLGVTADELGADIARNTETVYGTW